MKILFDIGHPAHVHYFKNVINHLRDEGHKIIIYARQKDVTFELLENYNLYYISRGKGSNSLIGKVLYLLLTDLKLIKDLRKEPPDLFIGFGSPYAAQVSWLLKKKSIIMDDTENAKLGQFFYKRFTTCILSPKSFNLNFGSKHIKFDSYMELAYLHNKYFNNELDLYEELEIPNNEKYCILRFVSWNANHDYGHKGISKENKLKIVSEFSKYAKVFITSESELDPEFEDYRLKISPELMHSVLSRASLLFGESATMASEAAVLGTPAIYLDNVGRGYTSEQQEKYGLVYNYTESESDQILAIEKGIEILNNPNAKKGAIEKSKKMISEKIDITSFLIWFIENYPGSKKIMKENPDYQYNFL